MSRPNKYHARKTTVDNRTFDSKGEARAYLELKRMQQAGVIRDLKLQVEFPLIVDGRPVRIRTARSIGKPVKHIVDFSYVDVATGKQVYADYKGMDLPMGRLKRALIEAMYPGVRIEVCK